jgi:hypothetical protein
VVLLTLLVWGIIGGVLYAVLVLGGVASRP